MTSGPSSCPRTPDGTCANAQGRGIAYHESMKTAKHEDHLFVLRIWREAAPSEPEWRATIEHVPTGKRLSSTDLKDVDDFVRLRLADVSERRV